jgi:dTMP kinase
VVFEGIEGCGKSTQSKLATEFLRSKKLTVVQTLEPGGTAAGQAIRAILLNPATEMVDMADLFLFQADRAQHCAEVIKPALERKEIVVSDRFYWSTMAYQGYGADVSMEALEAMTAYATNGIEPDIWFVLDLEPEVGFGRKHGDSYDRFEQKTINFHHRVRQGFLELAGKSDRAVIINADASPVVVTNQILSHLAKKLGLNYHPALDL